MEAIRAFESWFDTHPDAFPYNNANRSAIKQSRKNLDDKLYFDLLLAFFDIQGNEVYPPKDIQALRNLFNLIQESELDQLKKHCMVLYLLKDWNNDRASSYETTALIPLQYRKAMQGYWLMDHNEPEQAIGFLTDPSVTPDFVEKIVADLAHTASPRLALDFYEFSGANITSEESAKLHMDLLCHTSISDAFFFTRSCDLDDNLLVQLFSFCFAEPLRKDAVETLMTLPFSEKEEAGLVEYCSRSTANAICGDFLLVYYIQRGRFQEAVAMSDKLKDHLETRAFSSSINRNVIVESLRGLLPGSA